MLLSKNTLQQITQQTKQRSLEQWYFCPTCITTDRLTQFFVNSSNTKFDGNCPALELFHADGFSYVLHGTERAWNRWVNSAFGFIRTISCSSGSKNWNLSFLHESLKMVHDPLFFLAPDSTTHIIPDKQGLCKLIHKTKVFMAVLMVLVAFQVTAPCSLVRGSQNFGGI